MTSPSLTLKIQTYIADLNEKINKQLNCVLHHPSLQKQEATWRSLHQLIKHSATDNITIKILDLSLDDLLQDVEKAYDFEQTNLFIKIYHDEYDSPGGEPFSLLLGDYYFSQQAKHTHALSILSKIAHASFAPIITSILPEFINLNSFEELQKINHQEKKQIIKNLKWNLHENEEVYRFLGLTLPRTLIRPAHNKKSHTSFQEIINKKEDFLWGNAAYILGENLITLFKKTKWFLTMEKEALHSSKEIPPSQQRYHNELFVPPHIKEHLSTLGFIYLDECPYTQNITFFSYPSFHSSKKENKKQVNNSLQDILCLSRLAHYIKIIARNKIGTFKTPKQSEEFLQSWLHYYTSENQPSTEEIHSKYPLKKSHIKIELQPGNTQQYHCEINLIPHFSTYTTPIEFQLTLKTTIPK